MTETIPAWKWIGTIHQSQEPLVKDSEEADIYFLPWVYQAIETT